MGRMIEEEQRATIRRIVPETANFKILKSSEAYSIPRKKNIWFATPRRTQLDKDHVLLWVESMNRWVLVTLDKNKVAARKTDDDKAAAKPSEIPGVAKTTKTVDTARIVKEAIGLRQEDIRLRQEKARLRHKPS